MKSVPQLYLSVHSTIGPACCCHINQLAWACVLCGGVGNDIEMLAESVEDRYCLAAWCSD